MSHWFLYDDFVDLVREKHHGAFSGLITGVSDDQHSFQMGFDNGDIVLLSYRIRKGRAALNHIMRIESVKITEHPSSDITQFQTDLPPTSEILSRLTSSPSATETDLDEITLPDIKPVSPTSASQVSDDKLKRIIESAAVHHFGPIGVMVCEEHLNNTSIDQSNFRAMMLRIAADVGASEADSQAFINAVNV